MIALTQEKRESEIQKIKETIGKIKGDMDIGWNAEEYLLLPLEVALASLTATPEYHVFKHPLGKLFYSLVDESCKGHEDVYPVYAAPPVPEIKLPSRIENIHLRTPLEVEDMWLDRFKRLNGLGE